MTKWFIHHQKESKMRLTTLLTLWLGFYCCMQAQERVTMLVGTYTDGNSKGVYSLFFDQENGKAVLQDSLSLKNPSFLKRGRFFRARRFSRPTTLAAQ